MSKVFTIIKKETSIALSSGSDMKQKKIIVTKTVHMQESPKQKKGSAPTLWLIYIGERKTTFVKAYGIKKRCY